MSHLSGRRTLSLLLPAVVLAVAACSGGAGPSSSPAPSGAPSDAPSPSPDAQLLEHPTGATDVVLRYEETGGFMMAGFAATLVPHFTLYGDGTIVYRDPTQEAPPMEGSVMKSNPLRTAKLTEEQIQDLLNLALGEGGLAVARPEYRNDMISDASTAIFTVNAGGVTKQVSVYALGLEVDPSVPDGPALKAFSTLAQSLTSLESGGRVTGVDYEPTAYRGVLLESPGMVDPGIRPWPWTELTPADFAPDADPNGVQFPHRTFTPAEVEALGISGFEGGLNGISLTGPDGMTYSFALRPLLPDEEA